MRRALVGGILGLLLLAALPENGRPLVWLDGLTTGGLFAALALFHVASDLAIANGARFGHPGDPAWTAP